jgi:hypothetical protein
MKIIRLEDDLTELRQLKIHDRITLKQFLKGKEVILQKIKNLKEELEEENAKKDN